MRPLRVSKNAFPVVSPEDAQYQIRGVRALDALVAADAELADHDGVCFVAWVVTQMCLAGLACGWAVACPMTIR
jgi:hypothetical protein